MSKRKLVKEQKHGSSASMPNPATVNCSEMGGVSKTINTPQGQRSDCLIKEESLSKILK